MKKWFVGGVILAAALLAASACKKADLEADKTAIKALVEADTVHFSGGTERDYEGPGVSSVGDTTLRFWVRGPQTHDSTPVVEVEVSGDSAWVRWSQHNYGQILIWADTPETTNVLWVKQLVERVALRATFLREGSESDDSRGWKLKGVSLAAGFSEPDSAVRIDSLRIQSSLREILIADPLNTFYRIDSLISFTPNELLTITLYTANAEDGSAFLHTFWGLLPVRLEFERQAGGVFVGTWHAQTIPWLRFAILDLVSRSTLYHPTEPYRFNGWLLPYLIKNAD